MAAFLWRVAFFGLLTPIAYLPRLLGRDPLARRFLPGADSYRRPLSAGSPRMKSQW